MGDIFSSGAVAISAPASRQLQRCGRIKASRLQSFACFELCEAQWVIVIGAAVGAVVCFICCVQMCVAGSCYVVSGGVVRDPAMPGTTGGFCFPMYSFLQQSCSLVWAGRDSAQHVWQVARKARIEL